MAVAATFAVGALGGVAMGLTLAKKDMHTWASLAEVVGEGDDGEEESEEEDDLQKAGPQARAAKLPETIGEVAHWQGFTMEEAQRFADGEMKQVQAMTPHEVLSNLQRGNARFFSGHANRPEATAFERRALIAKQFPQAAILSCSDSRVPTEIVFDQPLGHLFVVRVAGNCISTATRGSLQFAVHALKVKVLIVMGHEFCGAVKAAQQPFDQGDKMPDLARALAGVREGLDLDALSKIRDQLAADREAVVMNVDKQIDTLKRDKGIMAKVASGELLLLGAFYSMSRGIVDFLPEVKA